tara:strand:- start:23013 stop:24509 length:1497 start_codon:yes stop_codon:yes gene_type:complete
MLLDLDQINHLPSNNYPIVIIGAGIAGLTLALEIEEKFDNILILESGDLDINPDKQDDHSGLTENYGISVDHGKEYTKNVHQRWFGGTSHWAGISRPFDPIDFDKRNYINSAGWDISYDEYYKFIPRAAKYAGLEDSNFEKISQDFLNYPKLFNNSLLFDTKIEKVSLEPSFHNRFLKKIKKSKKITCVLNASVTDCNFNFKDKYHLKSFIFKNNNQREFLVSSDKFILCMGASENVRFLLNINEKYMVNIGNHSNKLGKCFMEHLWIYSFGYGYRYDSKLKTRSIYHTDNGTHLVYTMNEEAQKEFQLHNNTIGFDDSRILNENEISELHQLDKKIIKLINRKNSHNDLWQDSFYFRSEIAPNKDNFYYLSSETDKFNRKKINLVWGLDSEIKEKYITFMKLFAQEYATQTGGRVKITIPGSNHLWEDIISSGAHLMGTTPLSSHPQNGVVNTNLLIHNTSNLYISSSSVFPSSGGNTPTMNIIALTIRLADYLKVA